MYGSPRSYMTDRQGQPWQQTFFKRVTSLSTARWFFSLLNEKWWREHFADGVVTDFRVMQVRGHRVAGLLLEEDFSSLWVVEVVDHVGLITCGRGNFWPKSQTPLLGGVTQCLLIGNVTWEVVLDERIEEEDASVKDVERSCASMRDMVMVFFLCGPTQPWAWATCVQGCELCVHWDNCVQIYEQFCETTEQKHTMNWGDKLKRNCTKTFVATFSHMLGTSSSDSNTVLSLNVSGQWSPEFQPLCFVHLDSLDSQSHVLGFALTKQQMETGTYSHFCPRPLRMSWLTCCSCVAVIACGIGLFHMARASSRPTSVQINTTNQFWSWCLAACLPPRRALTCA